MFFQPIKWEKGSEIHLSSMLNLCGIDGYGAAILERVATKYGSNGGITAITAEYSEKAASESYELVISENDILIRHSDERGLIYGCVTIQQLVEFGELYTGILYDCPDAAFRGYRGFLPGRKSFDDYYAMVDFLVYYKYNYLCLEIGGAMEYKRHPEINEAWKAYAIETRRYSGRALEIQHGYDWSKNAIHTDNGDGDVLTQDEVRTLVKYARERGLNVYPETPLLSHSDYICIAHPELAERIEDPYPDAYCPSNPDTYKIVFDILDEVIEVFEPEVINIGHDELYTVCICPRCWNKKPEDVYADDIIRIRDYLAEKGIRTAMWGDKLLPVITKYRCVGGMEQVSDTDKNKFKFPAMFRSQQRIPKDVLILHWFYPYGLQYDFVYHTQGLEALFGNLDALDCMDWRFRRDRGIIGGSCSNWGAYGEEYMQRNGQYRCLIFNAYTLWSSSYDTPKRIELLENTFKEAMRYHFRDIPQKHRITVKHTTSCEYPYVWFVDGAFITEKYIMGHYVVTYRDGSEVMLEVKYGYNIACDNIPIPFCENRKVIEDMTFEERGASCELCYTAMPSYENGRIVYTTVFFNPYPEKEIEKLTFIPVKGENVELISVEY